MTYSPIHPYLWPYNTQPHLFLQLTLAKTEPISILLFHFFPPETESYFAAQAGVQWYDLGSLQTPPPGFKPGDPQAEQPHGSPVRLFRPARLLCRRPGTAVLRTKSTGLCALLTGEWSYGKAD
ncbi:hypothetical protein AAY473_034793 [Plecturocebus cupreus]